MNLERFIFCGGGPRGAASPETARPEVAERDGRETA